jgi:hypothetical protein
MATVASAVSPCGAAVVTVTVPVASLAIAEIPPPMLVLATPEICTCHPT